MSPILPLFTNVLVSASPDDSPKTAHCPSFAPRSTTSCVELGTWFFGDNDDFLGETREQSPIFAAEVHLIKRFRPGFWASLDANYYAGGETRIGAKFSDDLQRNSGAGFTLEGRHALRA